MAKKLKGCEVRFFKKTNGLQHFECAYFEHGVSKEDLLLFINRLHEDKQHLPLHDSYGDLVMIPYSYWSDTHIKLENEME